MRNSIIAHDHNLHTNIFSPSTFLLLLGRRFDNLSWIGVIIWTERFVVE